MNDEQAPTLGQINNVLGIIASILTIISIIVGAFALFPLLQGIAGEHTLEVIVAGALIVLSVIILFLRRLRLQHAIIAYGSVVALCLLLAAPLLLVVSFDSTHYTVASWLVYSGIGISIFLCVLAFVRSFLRHRWWWSASVLFVSGIASLAAYFSTPGGILPYLLLPSVSILFGSFAPNKPRVGASREVRSS
jgi:hypothetical protein